MYELSPYIQKISVVAGNDISNWIKLMTEAMRLDIEGLYATHDADKRAESLKKLAVVVAQMEQLEKDAPHVKKMVDSLRAIKRKPTPASIMFKQMVKEMKKLKKKAK